MTPAMHVDLAHQTDIMIIILYNGNFKPADCLIQTFIVASNKTINSINGLMDTQQIAWPGTFYDTACYVSGQSVYQTKYKSV